ncbi:MAG: FAD-binding oxidoreductase [Anaerolineae bacterium]|nr:FAD-binding oxidoreductase [Anaerolineae bacterium]
MIMHPGSATAAIRDFNEFWAALRQLLPQLPVVPTPKSQTPPTQVNPLEEALQLSLQNIMDPARIACDAETLQLYRPQYLHTEVGMPDSNATAPAAITFPNSEQEIAQLLTWAEERELQILPWGGGGAPYQHKHPNAMPYIVVDLRHLNRILEISPQHRWVRAQAGVTWANLEESLAEHKLTTGQCSPWMTATTGGAVATHSISAKALRYGDLSRNLLAIKALCPAGPIRLASRPGAADERQLMLGAFGAWGIITETTLRLHSAPQEQLHLVATRGSITDALTALEILRHAGMKFAAARIINTREHSLFSNPASSSIRQLLRNLIGSTTTEFQLMLNLEGTREEVNSTRRQIEELLREKLLQLAGDDMHLCDPDYSQEALLLQKLRAQRVLAHTLTATVPWQNAAPFLRDWEEALHSILFTTGGLPGKTLTTLWATEDYAILRTLLLGFQPAGADPESGDQIQDIQAVALAIKQRWHVEEPSTDLVCHALSYAGEVLDPNSVMLR